MDIHKIAEVFGYRIYVQRDNPRFQQAVKEHNDFMETLGKENELLQPTEQINESGQKGHSAD